MIRFLKSNQEWVLATIGLLLLLLLAWCAIWTVTEISLHMSDAMFAGVSGASKIEFNLGAVNGLNLRGLNLGVSTSTGS